MTYTQNQEIKRKPSELLQFSSDLHQIKRKYKLLQRSFDRAIIEKRAIKTARLIRFGMKPGDSDSWIETELTFKDPVFLKCIIKCW